MISRMIASLTAASTCRVVGRAGTHLRCRDVRVERHHVAVRDGRWKYRCEMNPF